MALSTLVGGHFWCRSNRTLASLTSIVGFLEIFNFFTNQKSEGKYMILEEYSIYWNEIFNLNYLFDKHVSKLLRYLACHVNSTNSAYIPPHANSVSYSFKYTFSWVKFLVQKSILTFFKLLNITILTSSNLEIPYANWLSAYPNTCNVLFSKLEEIDHWRVECWHCN